MHNTIISFDNIAPLSSITGDGDSSEDRVSTQPSESTIITLNVSGGRLVKEIELLAIVSS